VAEVTVERRGGRARASVLQEPARFGDELAAAPLAAALGLRERDGHRELRPQRVSTGLPTIVVPLASAATVARAEPDWSALERLGSVNVYAFALDGSTARVRARGFPTPRGEGEDAATGSAAGALMAYLHRWTGRHRIDVRQGAEIGRPSRLVARVEGDRVRVVGDAVVLVTGEIRLPAPRRRQ
jgi:trans-2,3-dihydro-3-hydroxyanthranilate isomerase